MGVTAQLTAYNLQVIALERNQPISMHTSDLKLGLAKYLCQRNSNKKSNLYQITPQGYPLKYSIQ
jgi:hypothetical protein